MQVIALLSYLRAVLESSLPSCKNSNSLTWFAWPLALSLNNSLSSSLVFWGGLFLLSGILVLSSIWTITHPLDLASLISQVVYFLWKHSLITSVQITALMISKLRKFDPQYRTYSTINDVFVSLTILKTYHCFTSTIATIWHIELLNKYLLITKRVIRLFYGKFDII